MFCFVDIGVCFYNILDSIFSKDFQKKYTDELNFHFCENEFNHFYSQYLGYLLVTNRKNPQVGNLIKKMVEKFHNWNLIWLVS